MRKTTFALLLCLSLSCCAMSSPLPAESAEKSDTVEIEYDGKIITVDMRDLIITTEGLQLDAPEKYADQINSAPAYGKGSVSLVQPDGAGQIQDASPAYAAAASNRANQQEISEREFLEERQARQWANIVEDLSLRQIDEKALELVKEYSKAEQAVPPFTGDAGSLVLSYSTYIPKIVCRPMYVTDIILQPGEMVTGVHPGDPVRWTFTPGRSGSGDKEQIHVFVKPLMADISTNVIINTDRRTYQLDLMSDSKKYVPSVSFSYPADTLAGWKEFINDKKTERQRSAEISSGYSVAPEDLHLNYEIRGKDSLRWKPVRVWDDGVKTYIQFAKGSVKKSVEAPVLVVFEHKKETLVNYRAAEDMYIVDKVFESGALIAGTGSHQDRVVIKRLKAN